MKSNQIKRLANQDPTLLAIATSIRTQVPLSSFDQLQTNVIVSLQIRVGALQALRLEIPRTQCTGRKAYGPVCSDPMVRGLRAIGT